MDIRYKFTLLLLISAIMTGCQILSPAAEEPEPPAPPFNPNIPLEPITLEVWLDLDFTRNNSLFE